MLGVTPHKAGGLISGNLSPPIGWSEAEKEHAFPLEGNQGRISDMDGRQRSQIKLGMRVHVVQKQDQRSGKLTEGIVQAILTNSPMHPHGIKVRLVGGKVGRVQAVLEGTGPTADGK